MVSAGFKAIDLTAMRSSLGPGVGVGRVVRVKGEDLEGRRAARWVAIFSDIVVVYITTVVVRQVSLLIGSSCSVVWIEGSCGVSSEVQVILSEGS